MILSILPAPRRCREVGPAHSFIRSLGHYLPRDWPPRCQEACWLWGRLSREKRSSLVLETLSFKGRQTTARRRGALRAGTEAWGGAGGGSPAETPDQHRSGRASRRRRQASHYCAVPVHVEPPAWHQPSVSCQDVSVSEAHFTPPRCRRKGGRRHPQPRVGR